MLNSLFLFLKREGDFSFWRNIILMAILSGLVNAGLIAIVNIASQHAENRAFNYYYLLVYILFFIIFYFTKKISMVKAGSEVERIVKNTRDRIFDKIQNSELLTIEKIEISTLFTKFTRDTSIITQSSMILISAGQSSIMIFFAFLYIFFISKLMFFVILCSIILTILIYFILSDQLGQEIYQANHVEEKFFDSLNSILVGFKELKMNFKKSQDISKKHNTLLYKLFHLRSNLNTKTASNIIFTEVFLYILLGTIVFVIPHIVQEESITILSVTAILLFIIGPLETVVSIVPTGIRAISSIDSIFSLEAQLDGEASQSRRRDKHSLENFHHFQSITLKEIEFHYSNDKKENIFGIGPINFEMKRGEIIFIVGGNGSGKSTFIKTLLRLYPSTKGQIYLDNTMIDTYNYQMYRDLFSIILSDFYMFEEIYDKEIDYTLMQELLIEMQLNDKTRLINGKFSTVNLSTGQKKRLALIIAILEDKPIYVFDEWAADQDPAFRKYFYETILLRLKSQGKIVIAVTHDDAYFKCSDKVFKMDYGKLRPYQGVTL